MLASPSILRNHVTQLRVTFDPNSHCVSPEPGAECRSDRSDAGGGWDGGLHPLWPVVGPHQDLQVKRLNFNSNLSTTEFGNKPFIIIIGSDLFRRTFKSYIYFL